MPEKYQRVDFRDEIAKNKWKSFFLIFVIFCVIIALGYVIGKAWGTLDTFSILIIAIVISISYILITYYNSDKIALASVGAREAKRENNKLYYDVVEGMTIASGLPMPKLYIMPSEQINAFASGRSPKNSVVCVTKGALEKLDRRELEGVVAHELGHIGSYDMKYMTLVAVMVGVISIVSEIFLRSLRFRNSDSNNNKGNAIFILIGVVLAILAPIFVYFVQLSISRKREYSADASAVKFTRFPPGLIGALEKIKSTNAPDKKVTKAIAPLFFANPFKELGSTHPSLEKRIELLKRM